MWYRTSILTALAGLLLVAAPVAAADRLNDEDLQKLLQSIEQNRSKFEGALDDELKNSTLRGPRGEVKTNEFFDDLQDQVNRARERFSSDYSASSEIVALLDYTSRLDTWVKGQSTTFKGSAEYAPFAADLRRLASAYNTTFPQPANATARRINDAELLAAAANVEKYIDPFKKEFDATLTSPNNQQIVGTSGQVAAGRVDTLKANAHALHARLADKQKGIEEAQALITQALSLAHDLPRYSLTPGATSAWIPLRAELGRVAEGYEMSDKDLPAR
jgi:hypothetical protein